MKISLIPTEDRVIVRPNKSEEKVGNILLPEQAKKKPAIGVVLAVGRPKASTALSVETEIKVGDTIYYTAYAGTEIEKDGEKYLVLSFEDVMAIDR